MALTQVSLDILTKAGIIPAEKSAVKIIGTIQWIFVSTDQPYANNAIATRGLVNINRGSRHSGSETPPFLAVSFLYVGSLVFPQNTSPRIAPVPSYHTVSFLDEDVSNKEGEIVKKDILQDMRGQ